MSCVLFGDPVSSVSCFSDEEIIYIMSRVNPLEVIDDIAAFFTENRDRAEKIEKKLRSSGPLPVWFTLAIGRIADSRPELMGLFNLSWKERVINDMRRTLKGQKELSKTLVSWWGENTKLVDLLHNQYLVELSAGASPVSFSVAPGTDGSGGEFTAETDILSSNIAQKTGLAGEIVDAFLRALFVLTRAGRIDLKKLDPVGYKEAKAVQKTTSGGGIVGDIKSGASAVLLVAALFGVGYLVSGLKKG